MEKKVNNSMTKKLLEMFVMKYSSKVEPETILMEYLLHYELF